MSQIAQPLDKKIDKQAASLVANIDDDREGSSLHAPYRLELDLEDVKRWCTQDINIDGVSVPRYGLISLMLQTTPCLVYGHEAIKKSFGKTAFTDGVHIWICDEFYDRLLKDSAETKGAEYGIELLLMHELMHVMFNHVNRLRIFPPHIRNIATDLAINTKLRAGFPDLPWVKSLREYGLGFKPGDIEAYAHLSEETIARELLNEEFRRKKEEEEKNDKNKNKGQQGKGQQQGQGQGQEQGQGQGQSQPGSGQGQGKGQGQSGPNGNEQGQGGGGSQEQNQDRAENEQGQGGGEGEEENRNPENFGEDDHLVDLRDVIKVLEENDLQNVMEKLNLPPSSNIDKIQEREEEAAMRRSEAIQNAAAKRARVGDKFPGAHIADAASDMVRGFTAGKLSWKLAIRDAIFGDGMKFKYNLDEPGDLYYVEELVEFLGTEVYMGQDLPFKPEEVVLCMIDTSGSVDEGDVRAFLNEIFELKMATSGFGDSASEVIVLSADTVLRGEPIEINDNNVDEFMSKGVKIFGRGGTDLAEPIRQATKLPLFHEKKIRSLVYFSDLFASIPRFEELNLPEGTSVTYISAPTTTANSAQQEEAFRQGVKDYALVIPIRDDMEVNLNSEEREIELDNASRKKNKMR